MQLSQPNEEDKIKKSFAHKASTAIQKPTLITQTVHEKHVSLEARKEKDYTVYKDVNFAKEKSMEMHKSESTTNITEETRSCQEVSLNAATGCKINSKIKHICAYTSTGEVTLNTLADAICQLNGK